MSTDGSSQKNLDIQNNPKDLDPNLPVEAQMEKASGESDVEKPYKDSPTPGDIVYSTHDRDSVQPPSPGMTREGAPEMPLKGEENK